MLLRSLSAVSLCLAPKPRAAAVDLTDLDSLPAIHLPLQTPHIVGVTTFLDGLRLADDENRAEWVMPNLRSYRRILPETRS